MLRMTQSEMQQIVKQRLEEDKDRGLGGLGMQCVRSGGKWSLILSVDESMVIRMKSHREQVRGFANLDSAHKVATSIVNHMEVIGQ